MLHVLVNKKMEPFKIEKADFSQIDKSEVLNKATKDESFDITSYVKEVNEPRYLYWDEVKYKSTPRNLNSIEYWFLVKQLRKLVSIPTPIKAENGNFFRWIIVDNPSIIRFFFVFIPPPFFFKF